MLSLFANSAEAKKFAQVVVPADGGIWIQTPTAWPLSQCLFCLFACLFGCARSSLLCMSFLLIGVSGVNSLSWSGSGFSLWGLLSLPSMGSRCAFTSVVVAYGLSCPEAGGIFLGWDQTRVPFISRQNLNHWTARKALGPMLLTLVFTASQMNSRNPSSCIFLLMPVLHITFCSRNDDSVI